MNIVEHIEAGHYGDTPVVKVPTRCGQVALIYSTRHPGPWCIVGVVGDGHGAQMWPASGRISGSSTSDEPFDLMPPSRRVKTPAAACIKDGVIVSVIWDVPHRVHTQEIVRQWRDGGETVAEFTIEYDAPWE